MGSQSPDHQQAPNGHNDVETKPARPDIKDSQSNSASADLDRGIVGDEDGDDIDREPGVNDSLNDQGETKKKRKKRNKKKTKSQGKLEQTVPPSVELSNLFQSGYPIGQLVPYENTSRTTDEESRYNSRLWDDTFLSDYRKAAEIHRQVRQYVLKDVIKPGASLLTIAEAIDNGIYALSGHQGLETGDGLKAGPGFPTGLCLNNVAAHWTPNPGGKEVLLRKSDVLKVDFGVHVNGRIVDSAFTVAFGDTYDSLLEAVKEATNTGISHAGVDARMSDLGAAIQEVMESYEVESDGKSSPVKAVRNITGHDILPYHIHGGKQIPFVKNDSQQKMEEGEVYAIETFGTTGRAVLFDDVGIYGYGRNEGVSDHHLQLPTAKSLLKTIDANFGTLVFCRRYLERLGVKKYHLGMKQLIDQGIVDSYAPLVDTPGSCVAQFEHTILLHSGGKEVISRGEDY